MGYTNKEYPVFEIAISCEHGGTHTNGTKERKCVGDIIALREPLGAIGSGEMSGYIWLLIEGLEVEDASRLTDLLEENGVVYDKRRFCIPLERLKAVVPAFNINRAKDLADKYQPFMNVDEETPFRQMNAYRPLNCHGLIYDKLKSRFI